jgi:thiol:disulfide interchange protein DsbC
MSQLKSTTIALLALAIGFAAPAFAMSTGAGCGGDCASCHSITLQEANVLLKNVGSVQSVKPAAVRGLYELSIERGGKTGVAYLDYGKKHIIAGQVFEVASLKVVEAPAAVKRIEHVDPATLQTEHALLMGNPKGKKRLFVFTDPECPFCAKMHDELKKLVALEPDLAVYVKLFPLKMHPHAYDKARMILGERSLKLLEKSFAGEALAAPGPRHPKKPIDDTIRFANAAGINSTPTLVLPDGRILPGYREAKSIQELLR